MPEHYPFAGRGTIPALHQAGDLPLSGEQSIQPTTQRAGLQHASPRNAKPVPAVLRERTQESIDTPDGARMDRCFGQGGKCAGAVRAKFVTLVLEPFGQMPLV